MASTRVPHYPSISFPLTRVLFLHCKLRAGPAQGQPLQALVLCPTRELAIQVKDHMVNAAKYTGVFVCAVEPNEKEAAADGDWFMPAVYPN